jgi:hypothetical protein
LINLHSKVINTLFKLIIGQSARPIIVSDSKLSRQPNHSITTSFFQSLLESIDQHGLKLRHWSLGFNLEICLDIFFWLNLSLHTLSLGGESYALTCWFLEHASRVRTMTNAGIGFSRIIPRSGAQRIIFRLHTRSPKSFDLVTLSEFNFLFSLECRLLFRGLFFLDRLSTSSKDALHDTLPKLFVIDR